ncbi:hypothetical protein Salat_2627300 [Sesamum alatum]|uniref:Uncharacterized protein n=1 Tax=Sesamum alatum TaxID=300844 RepID=A0AAE1XPP7_9LAMI|nr:hypothetical protein Salat_2627300 [Sesamum alatum]
MPVSPPSFQSVGGNSCFKSNAKEEGHLKKAVNFDWARDHSLEFYEGKLELLCQRGVDDLERDRQEHAVEPNATIVGGLGDDDDGMVFMGTSDENEPHDVVDFVSNDEED